MATQVMGQSSGGGSLFSSSGNMGMGLTNDMYDLHDLSKAELAAPQLIMLANVALTGEVNGSCCDYLVGEERQMAELMPVGDNNFSDSDGEGLEESAEMKGEANGLENLELRSLELIVVEPPPPVFEPAAVPEVYSSNKDPPPEIPGGEDKCKTQKTKPFRCKPCQYEAESEEQFVHHIRVHSAKKFFVEESAEKQAKAREPGSSTTEEGDFSKGPIRCDRCGYNTNRYDHYTAHLKHHSRAGDSERVFKCIICTYTTVSKYHWRKHLRNHFPRKVYTCGKCSYFSDRKNNYVQHVRTHTGERPYKCELCPYSSSQKTHLTRHMRTHSGEKPFKCDQCSYVASNQHEVTRHARQVHNGPKPLNCPYCDYKTADRSNFKKHVELHVNPRQFNCPVCDYAASKKCNLQYHFKSKHPTCPNKMMDVSKVKLKKTKKQEADLRDNNITNEKTETEQTKIKGDVAGKKNEKSIKAEKKDNVSKEKKPCSSASVVQVTRTRKSAVETKETEIPPGNDISVVQGTRTRKSAVETKETEVPLRNEVPVVQMTRTRKSALGTKEEKKDVPSENDISVAQVTRTCKVAVGTKEAEVPSGNNSEKSCKTRKNKRKVEAEAHSLPDLVNEEPVAKRKKKIESKSKHCLEVPKCNSKMEAKKEENKKQKTCFKKSTKKKGLKNKSSKSSSKPIQKEPAQTELPTPVEPIHVEAPTGPQTELPPPVEDAQAESGTPSPMEVVDAESVQISETSPPMEVVQAGPPQTETPPSMDAQAESETPPPMEVVQAGPPQTEIPPPMEVVHAESVQIETPPMEVIQAESVQVSETSPPIEVVQAGSQMETSPPMDPAQTESPHMEIAQMDPPPVVEPPVHKPITRRSSPRKDNKREKLDMQSETARQEQVLIEVGLVPVRESQLLKKSENTQDALVPSPLLPKANIEETTEDQKLVSEGEGSKVGAGEADKTPADGTACKDSASVTLSEPSSNLSEGETLDGKYQRGSTMIGEVEMSTAETVPGKDSATELDSPLLLPSTVKEQDLVSQTVLASPSVTVAVNESQEIDEDEGIHSHDGSDLSDNMSEGSDDSGLHGARPVPQETSSKNAKEVLAVKVTEGDFVCIFCDRSFRKEKDYSKHLNRHLVNVYFLEKAAKGQE